MKRGLHNIKNKLEIFSQEKIKTNIYQTEDIENT
jgi:hypothetical protein